MAATQLRRISLRLSPSVLVFLPSAGLAQQTATDAPPPITISAIEGESEGDEGLVFAFGVFEDNPTREALTYRWEFGDNTTPVQDAGRSSISHYFKRDSTYTVTVDIRGSQGFSARRTLDVTVNNAPPVIRRLDHDPTRLLGEPFPFRAEVIDPGEDRLTYIWDYGDGTPPDSGVGMRRVSHRYAKKGAYTLTLTVRDESYDPDLRHTVVESIAVEVMPAWTATVTGALEMDLEGYVGPPPGPTASVPVVALPPANVCSLNKALWDDTNKAVIPFFWQVALDSLLDARTFGVRDGETMAKTFGAEQATFAMTVCGIDPVCQVLWAQAAARPGLPAPTLGAIAGQLNPRNPRIVPGALAGGSGRIWAFLSDDGVFQVEAITEDRLKAAFDVNLTGHWQDASGNVAVSQQIQVKGKLVWRFNAQERANFAICQNKPFEIESHSPAIEERNTDFADAEVRVDFTYPFRPGTINSETFRVGYLKPGGDFQPIQGRRTFSADGMTVVFYPADTLMDAVFYHVKLTGGQSGIRGLGDQELPDDYEWRFATMPNLVPTGSGGGVGSSGQSSFGEGAFPRGPAADGQGFGGVDPPGAAQGSGKNWCGRPHVIDEPRQLKNIQIEVHIFQAVCNKPLVPGKRTVVRVYADWGKNNLVDDRRGAIRAFEADVALWKTGGVRFQWNKRKRFVRPDLYQSMDVNTAEAKHSENFFEWRPDTLDGSPLKVAVFPIGKDSRIHDRVFFANRAFQFWDYGKPFSYELDVYLLKIGPWEASIPRKTRTEVYELVARSARFATANHPVNRTLVHANAPLAVDPPVEVNNNAKCTSKYWEEMRCIKYKLPKPWLLYPWEWDVWLSRTGYFDLLFGDRVFRKDRQTVMLIPYDDTPWLGITIPRRQVVLKHTRPPTAEFAPGPPVAVLAHELGHYFGDAYGLEHDCSVWGCEIEGFRLEDRELRKNKSDTEGNAESALLASLMEPSVFSSRVAKQLFVNVRNYDQLLRGVSDYASNIPANSGGGDADAADESLGAAFGDWTPARESLWSDSWKPAVGGPSPPLDALAFRGGMPRRQTTPYISITGAVRGDGRAAGLFPLYTFEGSEPMAPQPGPFTVALYDSNDDQIQAIPFDPGPLVPTSDPMADLGVPFRVVAPAPPDLARVAILDAQGQVIGERRRSGSPPTVSLTPPNGGATLTGRVRLSWIGGDADGDALSYSLLYSRDGVDWAPLAISYSPDTLTIDTALLPPGPSPMLKVEATDGFDAAEDQVAVTMRNGLPLQAVLPGPGDTVSVFSELSVALNTTLDPAALPGDALTLMDAIGQRVAGTVGWDEYSNTLYFAPHVPLQPSTVYSATLGAGLSDPYGNRLAADSTWSFVTEADRDAPRVEDMTPDYYAITVFPESEIRVQFDEAMDPATLTPSSFMVENLAGAPVGGSVAYDAGTRTALFRPDQPLELKTSYRATVTTAATDTAGNALAQLWTWEFTTAGLVRPLRQ